jgi:hypothetical protein
MLEMLADGTAITTPGGWVHGEEFYGFMSQGGAASVQICAWYLGRFTDFMPELSGKIKLAPPPVWDIWETDIVNQPNKYTAYFGDNFFDVLMMMKDKFYPMNITASSQFSRAHSLVGSNILFMVQKQRDYNHAVYCPIHIFVLSCWVWGSHVSIAFILYLPSCGPCILIKTGLSLRHIFFKEITMNRREALSTDYVNRIAEIKKELRTKTLGQAEQDRNITNLDYIGVGFGYNLKGSYPKTMEEALNDAKTPELDRLENLARQMG